jgi:ketosteroid isomerase-like protein
LAWLAGCAAVTPQPTAQPKPQLTAQPMAQPTATELKQQVAATETAFAKTMADRDHAAFTSFLADEAVFLGGAKPLRGKQQVAEAWKRYYEKPAAPFSWQSDKVEVLESGGLALSLGSVHDAKGKLIGSFTSIWRREAHGVWRIIFDTGDEACDCAKP